ncbi:MAG: ABC transporter substrate-binding protein [Defluviitaleaceae bacterium]|nr:ABC transporter substrate-binding protein [Defluviitaleaceae bacterium]
MIKRILSVFLLLLIIVVVAACQSREEAPPELPITPDIEINLDDLQTLTPVMPVLEPASINMAVLPGPSAIGSLYLMEHTGTERFRNDYNIQILGTPDEIPPMINQGSIDIAAVPTNLASILYNVTNGGISVLAISTMGVLHIVDTTGEINEMADLAGRTVHLSGMGASPEFVMNHVLRMNNLEPGRDVTLEFHGEQPQIAALMAEGAAQIALLPEPFATTVVAQNEAARFALDMTEEWSRVQPDFGLVMTAIIVRNEFLQNNPDAVELFMQDFEASIYFANNSVQETAQLAADFGIIPNPNIAAQAIPRTNQVFLEGSEMKQYLSGYLGVLYEALPQSVGGNLPSESFYFIR